MQLPICPDHTPIERENIIGTSLGDSVEEAVGLSLTLRSQERAGELALWLRELTALAEDSGSVPSTHMMGHNHQ